MECLHAPSSLVHRSRLLPIFRPVKLGYKWTANTTLVENKLTSPKFSVIVVKMGEINWRMAQGKFRITRTDVSGRSGALSCWVSSRWTIYVHDGFMAPNGSESIFVSCVSWCLLGTTSRRGFQEKFGRSRGAWNVTSKSGPTKSNLF